VVPTLPTHSAEDVAQGATAMQQTAITAGGGNGDDQEAAAAPAASAEPVATMKPVVKSEWEKTPRNAPCPCGSGKKYKMCHGK
jgi:preprotein translocase subunit SecA